MPKRARIVHQNSETIDFAPGVDNVVLRKDGTEFYSTETFHSSPFYNRTVPLLIKDIVNSNDLINIYGIHGLRPLAEKVLLVNNHPIRKVRILGRITEYFIKEIKSEEVYFVTLDDSSGCDITVKISRSKLLGAGLQPSSCTFQLIEISGFCSNFNGKLEVHPEFIQVLRKNDKYINEEVQFWKESLEMRIILNTPWCQTPQVNSEKIPEVRLEAKAYKEKLIRQKLDIGAGDYPSHAMVMDSQIYMKNTRDRDDYSTAMLSGSESEKEPEIEEITKKLFIRSIKKRKDPVPSPSIATSQQGWVNISSVPIKNMAIEISFKFELIKWIIKNSKEKFNLNEPFKNKKISQVLKQMTTLKPTPTIEVEAGLANIQSINDLKGQIFHDGRHDLQAWNLIKCTRSKECYCAPVLRLFKYLRETLENIRLLGAQGSNNTSLFASEFVNNFNKNTGLKVCIDIELLNILIQWTILKNDDKNWKYNTETKEWQYISSFKRRKLVPLRC